MSDFASLLLFTTCIVLMCPAPPNERRGGHSQLSLRFVEAPSVPSATKRGNSQQSRPSIDPNRAFGETDPSRSACHGGIVVAVVTGGFGRPDQRTVTITSVSRDGYASRHATRCRLRRSQSVVTHVILGQAAVQRYAAERVYIIIYPDQCQCQCQD